MKKSLYNDPINEYIDWVSGVNSLTGLNETGNKAVSGYSIRKLLQDRLQHPFVMKEDIENNLYRMFSSEESYNKWVENPSDNSDLQLFSFVRPSDYRLTITIDSSNRYIRYGDSTNDGAKIQYVWSISNDEGNSTDSLTATYTIVSSNSGKTTSFTRYYNNGDPYPNFSIYDYLELGTNTVTIEGKGTSTGARNSITFNVVLLNLNITSTFDFYSKREGVGQLRIPYTFERNNTDGSAKIYFVVDEGPERIEATRDIEAKGPSKVTSVQTIPIDLEPGLHSLQIWAVASYNDGSVQINSNLLYFTFVVASESISTSKYICVANSFNTGSFPLSKLTLSATQYLPQTLQWGYYTDSLQADTSISVEWRLYKNEEDSNPQILSTMTANTQQKSDDLQYVPTIYSTYDEDSNTETFLSAYFGDEELIRLPIHITQNSSLNVYETGSYALKMSAYGKTNDSTDKSVWKDVTNTYETTFVGISWDPNSGWYNNSFRTVGQDQYATINYEAFSNFDFSVGKTIEIEFESEKVNSDDDVLIVIGNENRARIEITPNSATLYNNANTSVVHTNYKANERLKLAFIINSDTADTSLITPETGLAYIVNNGVLERAALASGSAFQAIGGIKIGGSKSGVRVYNIRVYNYAISYTDAYNNYVYDSDNKMAIANNNNVLDQANEINYDLCKNKLDTFLISGDLSNILQASSDKELSTTDVTIERICPYDTTKNFKIGPVQIRKHGQSTLNYPITSMKFWTNKSKSGNQPVFEIAPNEKLELNKNRYRMKNTSIPTNKFVLQANYADSSGVHNGGLLRLIQHTWYNAQIDGEYKLRTAPQLFASGQIVHHNNANLNETGWIEGQNADGKTWNDYFNTAFPYLIEVAPDSLPCVVFYYDENGTQKRTFLGQYVFMEDKKSDYLFGERSIYKIQNDPFCLTVAHKKDDTGQNRVWNNKNVLRIEVIGAYNRMVGYMPFEDSSLQIDDIVEEEVQNADGSTSIVKHYRWEEQFEMIYPDPDDITGDSITGTDKFGRNSNFAKQAKPFIDWYKWLVGTYQNQELFQQEAAQHLDLYKLAAYYIFFLRFGLVDSPERNAQIKTYDGIHFHYEPWDMDIANGNKNDGGIAYNPPIDRNTKLPGSVTTYAYSGRQANEQGVIITSNWLWDALEAWPYWINTIVPTVADALYNAGLTYDNITEMFDEEYANAWCETIYNKSGYFKYIESGNRDSKWLNWLQGSRMTHRHWWLSTSMDYYDAKWFCGDYKNHSIYLSADIAAGNNGNIVITPNKSTYMAVRVGSTGTPIPYPVNQASPLQHNMDGGSTTKDPILIYGANFMEEIDMSVVAHGITNLNLDGVYSTVLGSPLKRLNVGVPITSTATGYSMTVSVSDIKIGITDSTGDVNAFESLQSLNIRGQRSITTINQWTYTWNLTELKDVYAMGSGLTNFYSSQSGNKFDHIEIPSTINVLELHNSTWNHLDFWDCDIDSSTNVAQLSLHSSEYATGSTNIPATLENVSFYGTTCQTRESIEFVRNWLRAIVSEYGEEALHNYNFKADKIYWTSETVGGDQNLLTYDELALLAKLNGPDGNKNYQLKGYIVLRNQDNTQLTAEQLTQIKSWFGDTVFNRNSSGLVIDHKLDYIQINLGGDVQTINGSVYVTEGGRVSLNATKFSLSETITGTYSWAVGDPNSNEAYQRYKGITVLQAEDSRDGIAYLQTQQSYPGGNYSVKVYCSAEGQNYSTILNVIGATYPSDMFIDSSVKSNTLPRMAANYVTYWNTGIDVDFFVNSNQEYTAGIKSIVYSLYKKDDETNKYTLTVTSKTKTSSDEWIDDWLVVQEGTNGVRIILPAAIPQNNSVYEYVLKAVVTFNSNSTMTVTKNILVMDDSTAIATSTQTTWGGINRAWNAQFGTTISKNQVYRTDLYALTGSISFAEDSSTLTNFITADGQNALFSYLPNITALNISGCTITSTVTPLGGSEIDQTDFTKMINLKALNISNCTNLTNDIDLRNCSDITTVSAQNTSVNVLIPDNAKYLASYNIGSPTNVRIVNPKVLTYTGVTVGNSTNITSVDVQGMPSLDAYKTFAKIMNI